MPASNSNQPPEPAAARPLHLFDAFGLELEYMLVDGETLDVVPAADQLLEAAAGELTDEFENGDVAWNHELALHVIELRDVGLQAGGDAPLAAQLGDERVEPIGAARAQHDLRAAARQLARGGFTDAAARAGDDDDLAFDAFETFLIRDVGHENQCVTT